MIYADFDFYKSVFFGESIKLEDFDRYASKASSFLDYYTMGKAKANPDMDEVKMACCAIAEKYQLVEISANGSGLKKSETVGSYSVSYVSSDEVATAARTDMARLAQQYLAGTGLLYRGGMSRCMHRTL